MGRVKKIALIICASNFERQKRVVHEVHEALSSMGDYALYVFTNYGIYVGDSPYIRGAKSIYELLKLHDFDGCIIDSNLGNPDMECELVSGLKQCGIPVIGLNVILDDIPFSILDGYSAQVKLMEHLIFEHHCTKINFVGFYGADIFTDQALAAYKDSLEKAGLPYEERRVIKQRVSIENGRDLYHTFKERGTDDAEATICLHDVMAIGLCLEMADRGLSVPEDMLLCTLNYSANSIGFRPSLTGIDRQDEYVSRKACELLCDMLEGREVPRENYYEGQIFYGQSCACVSNNVEYENGIYQDIILNKIEAGSQISLMMNYNDALETVESLQELGNNIFNIMQGQKGREFLMCFNKRDIGYILNEVDELPTDEAHPFDEEMVVIIGNTKEQGRISGMEYALKDLFPMSPKSGDIFILMPVHRNDRVYGYVVFINNYIPIDMYNHRILHESICTSIENLRRQMILRNSIRELDELHMHDALTGLYNRYAQERYANRYIGTGNYTVVMIDMDGLKNINDTYGHLAGNNALSIMADALRDCVDMSDLLIRYAGDEFLIISYNTNQEYWGGFSERLNATLANYVHLQKLPYELGASVGYHISQDTEDISFDDCYQQADSKMYLNKQARKVK
ncbi:MAG: GGDEF domain-containing protein [Lachnospiraceae bacterium]|nr:GGDEF domain-containing protein [Lachnospiraceae bacterium]